MSKTHEEIWKHWVFNHQMHQDILTNCRILQYKHFAELNLAVRFAIYPKSIPDHFILYGKLCMFIKGFENENVVHLFLCNSKNLKIVLGFIRLSILVFYYTVNSTFISFISIKHQYVCYVRVSVSWNWMTLEHSVRQWRAFNVSYSSTIMWTFYNGFRMCYIL